MMYQENVEGAGRRYVFGAMAPSKKTAHCSGRALNEKLFFDPLVELHTMSPS